MATFAGPVMPGSNETLFRLTGQTAPEKTTSGQSYYGPAFGPPIGKSTPVGKSTPAQSGQILGASSAPQQQSSGFNMSNYAGWDETAARADYAANPNKFNQSGPSQDDIMNQINEAYGASENYLNQAESAVRADHPSALAEAESIFKANSSQLGNSKDVAFQGLDTQKQKATTTKESALESARRMYQEQQMGANQRFGGSSSAGQAASELMAREQARQFGQTGRQYAEVTQQIEQQRQNVEKEYQTGLLQLEQQKQTAVSNANRDFQNKLLQISQNRAMIGQAKAEARLGALQELRNQVFAIEQQNTQFQQQIQMMREQANLQLQAFGQQANQGVGSATSAVSSFNPNMNSSLSATGGMGGQQQQQMMGQITPSRRQEDYFSNYSGLA